MLDLELPSKLPMELTADARAQDPILMYSLIDLGPEGIHGLRAALVQGASRPDASDDTMGAYAAIPERWDFRGQRLRDVLNYHLGRDTSAAGDAAMADAEDSGGHISPLFIVAYTSHYQQDGVLLVNLDTDGEGNVSTCPLETAEALSAAVNLSRGNVDWEDYRGPLLPVRTDVVLPGELDETHELWGGHARANLPPGYLDASEVRPIPDHQEVLVNDDPTNPDCRNSIVVSLCEAVTNGTKTDYEAFIYHIIDQLDDEGPCLAMSESLPGYMAKFPDSAVLMTQTMSKPQELEDGTCSFVVQLFLLLRLPSKETDVLVTVNIPYLSVQSGLLDKDPMMKATENVNLAKGWQLLETFARSFEILDWGFLGG